MVKKSNAGRKSKYETDVKPRFDEIKSWYESGATDREVFENLGISKNAFYKYIKEYEEFRDLRKKGQKVPVREIKAALFKRACGFSYQETKEVVDSEGYRRTETTTKYAMPDPASAMILLKHWAKDEGWTNDPAALELRKREVELKEKQAENESW